MTSRKEQILASLLSIIEDVAADDGAIASRNLIRTDDISLPAYVLHDGSEEVAATELAPGIVGNVSELSPLIYVGFVGKQADIGPAANSKLAALQKAILFDTTLAGLCGRARMLGPRYAGCELTISEGTQLTAELIVRFQIKYAFNPREL